MSNYAEKRFTKTCWKCKSIVYPTSFYGPFRFSTYFHKSCFKCATCDTRLNIATFCCNQRDGRDCEVYCKNHVPKIGPAYIDKYCVSPKRLNGLNQDPQSSSSSESPTSDGEVNKMTSNTKKPIRKEKRKSRKEIQEKIIAKYGSTVYQISDPDSSYSRKSASDSDGSLKILGFVPKKRYGVYEENFTEHIMTRFWNSTNKLREHIQRTHSIKLFDENNNIPPLKIIKGGGRKNSSALTEVKWLEESFQHKQSLDFLIKGTKMNRLRHVESIASISTVNSKVEFDDRRFLRQAIGEDLSKYKSILETFFRNDKTQEKSYSRSINSLGNLSLLVSKLSCLNSSITRRFKINVFKNNDGTSTVNLQRSALLQEFIIQQNIIEETSAALKWLNDIEETLQAERTLLVSSCKRDLLTMKIFNTCKTNPDNDCFGSLELQNISLKKKPHTTPNSRTYYLCVIQCHNEIKASEIIENDQSATITFPGPFEFQKVPANSEITVALYQLCVKNGRPNPKRSKIKNKLKKIFLGRRDTPTPNVRLHASSFLLCGRTVLKIQDTKRREFVIETMSPNCSLKNKFTADIEKRPLYPCRLQSYLDVGCQTSRQVSWDKYWCIQERNQIIFLAPPDRSPKFAIDFSRRNCQFKVIRRDVCCRPKTLMIEMTEKNGFSNRFFLSFKTDADLALWQTQLDQLLQITNNWL